MSPALPLRWDFSLRRFRSGRPCFEDLAAHCEEEFRAILIDTDTKKPTKATGYVLIVEDRR